VDATGAEESGVAADVIAAEEEEDGVVDEGTGPGVDEEADGLLLRMLCFTIAGGMSIIIDRQHNSMIPAKKAERFSMGTSSITRYSLVRDLQRKTTSTSPFSSEMASFKHAITRGI
jgi:hypothetical protein